MPVDEYGNFERPIKAIITGMLWTATVMIIQHSGPGVAEKLLEWPIYLLAGALIVTGIFEEVYTVQ